MSTSICGWIEVYLPIIEEWAAITKISLLVEQNYNAYVHVYQKLENGEYATSSSTSYIPQKPFNHRVGDVWVVDSKDTHFYDSGELHKVERITRGDALHAFQVVFDIMSILATQNGKENVRLVVWFD